MRNRVTRFSNAAPFASALILCTVPEESEGKRNGSSVYALEMKFKKKKKREKENRAFTKLVERNESSEDSVGEFLNRDRFRPDDRVEPLPRKRERERLRGARLKNCGAGSGG